MKKILFISMVLMLSACTTVVPVEHKFPEVPIELKKICDELKTIEGSTTTLSQLMSTVAQNYSKYHECAAQVDAWIEWYDSQHKIYKSKK